MWSLCHIAAIVFYALWCFQLSESFHIQTLLLETGREVVMDLGLLMEPVAKLSILPFILNHLFNHIYLFHVGL